jgi:hypothetical protein
VFSAPRRRSRRTPRSPRLRRRISRRVTNTPRRSTRSLSSRTVATPTRDGLGCGPSEHRPSEHRPRSTGAPRGQRRRRVPAPRNAPRGAAPRRDTKGGFKHPAAASATRARQMAPLPRQARSGALERNLKRRSRSAIRLGALESKPTAPPEPTSSAAARSARDARPVKVPPPDRSVFAATAASAFELCGPRSPRSGDL